MAMSCDALSQISPACVDPPTVCAAGSEKTNPYLRLTREKLFEQAKSVDRRMAAGEQVDIAEFLNTFVALGRLAESNAEAKRLQDGLQERSRRAAKQSLAEIKDERARHQLQAIDEISDCTDSKHKHHHSECGQRVIAQTPPEDRTKTLMDYVKTLATEDESDRVSDEITARSDRETWGEQFVRDVKAAKSLAEISAVKTRYCTGRGEPRIGMTMLEVEHDTTWCMPSAVNETITASGKRVQHVYHGDEAGSGGNNGNLYYEKGPPRRDPAAELKEDMV
jgi:hypothetical protein